MNSRHYLLIVFVMLCLVAQFMKPEGSVARMAQADRAQAAAAKLLDEAPAAPAIAQVAAQANTASQPSGTPQMTAAQLWATDTSGDDVRDNPDPEEEPIEIADYQPELVGPSAFGTPAAAPSEAARPAASARRDTGRMLSDNRSPDEVDNSVPFDPVVG